MKSKRALREPDAEARDDPQPRRSSDGFETVSVNGVAISEAEIANELQHHAAESLEEARALAARALVVRTLLLQEAERRGIEGKPSGGPEEDVIRRLLESEIELPEANEESCRRYYDQNPARFRSEAVFEAAHILVVAPPDDEEARAAARSRASEIAAAAVADPESFAALAKEHSACASARAGGKLGRLVHGQTCPEFERALHNLSSGEITGEPVETPYGFHVIKLIGSAPENRLPFSLVRERISEYLLTRAWAEAVHGYIELLAGRAEITGVEVYAPATPAGAVRASANR